MNFWKVAKSFKNVYLYLKIPQIPNTLIHEPSTKKFFLSL